MLVTLLVFAALALVVGWAFPNRAAVTAASAFAVIAAAVGVTAGASALRTTLDRDAVPRPAAPELGFDPQAGAGFAVDEGYLQWVMAAVPQTASYALRCATDPCADGPRQWTISRLGPRTPVTDPADADWLVLSGATPPARTAGRVVTYDAARKLSLVQLAPRS
jgi:hypothetical protein